MLPPPIARRSMPRAAMRLGQRRHGPRLVLQLDDELLGHGAPSAVWRADPDAPGAHPTGTAGRRLRYRPDRDPRTHDPGPSDGPARGRRGRPGDARPGSRRAVDDHGGRDPVRLDRLGRPGARPLVLLHGVTASSRVWWRVGPALAAAGHRVTAPDLPGHGLTGHWTGHHRFRDNAADVAAWIRAAGLDVPELQVVGHSWGGMTAAALPLAGIRPATLVLLDPPIVPHAVISKMASDPSERSYPDMDSAVAGLAGGEPDLAGPRRRGQGGRAGPTRRRRRPRHPPREQAIGTVASPTCRNPRPTASISGWSEATRRPAATFRTRCSPASRRGSATTTS